MRRGDCAVKIRSRGATFFRAGGVVMINHRLFIDQHHPVRSMKEASRRFINVASTPPQLRRGIVFKPSSLKFKLRHCVGTQRFT